MTNAFDGIKYDFGNCFAAYKKALALLTYSLAFLCTATSLSSSNTSGLWAVTDGGYFSKMCWWMRIVVSAVQQNDDTIYVATPPTGKLRVDPNKESYF